MFILYLIFNKIGGYEPDNAKIIINKLCILLITSH